MREDIRMKRLVNIELRRFCASMQPLNLIRCALFSSLFLFGRAAYSADATWRNTAADNNWNNPANWSTGSVPGDFDDATFDVSLIHDPEITLNSFIDKIIFDQTADAFTITATPGVYLALGDGVANNSGVEQNFVAESNGGTSGLIIFNGGEVTGPVTFTIQARNSATGYAGFLQFGFAGPGSATIHNLGASVAGGAGGGTGFFFGNNSAENSTIINDGATAAGATGGNCGFAKDEPTAGNATLIANGGSNGGGGGFFTFLNQSTGGTARVELFGNGYLDISAHGSEPITVGSLEGDGIVYLGRNTLTVGGNGLDTTFAGTLLPDDPNGGTGTGGLMKTSSAPLTLSGVNLYTAGTTVTDGTLVVSNTSGSATGTGAVLVNAGTLAGGGTIAGPVTIGTGSGAGAFLAPAEGGNKQLTLAIQSSVTLNADATYTYTFKAKRNKARADLVVVNGVTINGATVNLSGQTQGSLNIGLTLTMISNRSANPISGTFSNLPDGAIVTVNGNNFQASYSGGDGNDLTLTVVP
jgi:autotransporter-associated beta strand protein